MITMLSTIPLAPQEASGTEAFFALMSLMSDPNAAKERLQKLIDACLEANAAIRAANEAQKNLIAARELHDKTLQRERDEYEQKIAKANAAIDLKDQHVNSQLAERERLVEEREATAAVDATAAAELKTDFEQRVAKIKAAAA